MKMSGEYFDKLPNFCPGSITILFLNILKVENSAEAEMNMYRTQLINTMIKSIARIRPLINIFDSLCRKLRFHEKPETGILIVQSMIK